MSGGKRGKLISDREELLICQQYVANWAIRKIAVYANVSQTTVMSILKRRNIPLRAGKRVTEQQEQKVVELYKSGMSILEIISQTGVRSEQTIYRILRDAGVKKRRNTCK